MPLGRCLADEGRYDDAGDHGAPRPGSERPAPDHAGSLQVLSLDQIRLCRSTVFKPDSFSPVEPWVTLETIERVPGRAVDEVEFPLYRACSSLDERWIS